MDIPKKEKVSDGIRLKRLQAAKIGIPSIICTGVEVMETTLSR
jgi:hypothetical protein